MSRLEPVAVSASAAEHEQHEAEPREERHGLRGEGDRLVRTDRRTTSSTKAVDAIATKPAQIQPRKDSPDRR
jgi:hypothetical protein